MDKRVYLIYRKEHNAYSNAQSILVGLYFDKETAINHMKQMAAKIVEHDGLAIKQELTTRITLANVGDVVELSIVDIDFDPTGAPWLLDE